MPKKKQSDSKKTLPEPKRSRDLPATLGALDRVRSELKSDITSVKLEVKSVKLEVASVRADVKALEHKMDSKFEEIKATNSRMLALLEEQRAENRAALDGYAAVYESQQRLEGRTDALEKNQFDLAKFIKTREL